MIFRGGGGGGGGSRAPAPPPFGLFGLKLLGAQKNRLTAVNNFPC